MYDNGTIACDSTDECQANLISFPGPPDLDYYGGTLSIPPELFPYWVLYNRDSLAQRLNDWCCSGPPAPAKSFSAQAANPLPAPDTIVTAECRSTKFSARRLATIARLNRMSVESLELTLRLIESFVWDTVMVRWDTLTANIEIPAELNTGGRYCKTASEISALRFSGDYQVCYPNDTTGLEEGRLTNYLNGRLGWNRSWEDYATVLQGSDVCLICADPPAAPLIGDPEEDCKAAIRDQAAADARDYYYLVRDRRSRTFARDYRDACLDAAMEKDKLELRYTPREYHYTLYYYDQAGNLAMTVPPDGVVELPNDELGEVVDYRKDGSGSLAAALPDHRLLTYYRYNNFNEVTLSDAPDRAPSHTWYDLLGRTTMSRDGRQDDLDLVSYTLYDNLGRPYEVGEIDATQSEVNTTLSGLARGRRGLLPALVDRRDRYGVTRTFYSSAAPLAYAVPELDPLTLRNRVAAVTFQAVPPPPAPGEDEDRYYYEHYDLASHYRYDIGGNVELLVQDFAALAGTDHRYKTLEYDYDLISGNVHALYYQKGQADQFTYRYRYDKLNRLSEVFSSELETDHARSNLWKRDAEYVYYDHIWEGQGWIKGVNGSLGDDYRDVAAPDISLDGYDNPSATDDALNHRDLYRYANQYFDGDYRPIGLTAGGTSGILSPMDATLPPDYELFNGNIVRHYQSTIADGFRTAGLVGEYDQLNRLRFGTNAFYGTADAAGLSLTEALEAPTYDGNGNIRTLDRSYTSTTEQRHRNRLSYGYDAGTNLLTSVAADVHGAAINEDWLPFDLLRGTTSYEYDRSGNLVREESDKAAGATLIDWNAYAVAGVGALATSRVTTVASPTGTTSFGYGPDQNRWIKDRGAQGTTYYVRDAPRHLGWGPQIKATLATYELDGDEGAELTWKQQYLFGSSRLGEVIMDRPLPPGAVNPFNYGRRQYELTNHLGNVTTVFGENAVAYEDSQDGTTYTAPDLVSYRDYLAFGLGLDRGKSVLGRQGYRFAFNGKEVDDEGEWGNSTTAYDYGFRIYNPQLARFLSVDPLSPDYPEMSPYSYAGNNPLLFIDIDGAGPTLPPLYDPSNSFIRVRRYNKELYDGFMRAQNSSLSALQKGAWYKRSHNSRTNFGTLYGISGEIAALKFLRATDTWDPLVKYSDSPETATKAISQANATIKYFHAPDELTDLIQVVSHINPESPYTFGFDKIVDGFFYGYNKANNPRKVDYHGSATFVFEVKTISADNPALVDQLKRGIDNQLLRNPAVMGGGVPVLVVDEDVLQTALDGDRADELMDSINRLEEAGGGVFSIKGLNKKSAEEPNSLVQPIRDLTDQPPSDYYD